MFVYSVKASNIKFFAILILAVAVVIGLVASGGAVSASAAEIGAVDFSGIKTKDDRVAFLAAHGVSVNAESEKAAEVVIPENFDKVLLDYNEVQKMQGLDLSKYSRKRVTRYTYEVGGDDSGKVATLFVYRNRIVGCDVSSTDPTGSVEPIVKL